MSVVGRVVIGGGVVGAATAYYLARQGVQVALVDQAELASGCSRGNAGQVTPGHLPLTQPGTIWRNLRWLLKSTSPLYVAPRFDPKLMHWLWRFNRACNTAHLHRSTKALCELGAASAELFKQLAQEIGLQYENRGRLEICRTQATFAAACEEAKLLQDCGFQSQQIGGDQVRQFEPALETEVAGAIYYPDSGFCNPQLLVQKLATAAQNAGAIILPHTRVTDLRFVLGRASAVVTSDREIATDNVVFACGAWSPQWAKLLGLRLPVEPGKGYHLDIESPVGSPSRPVVLVDERIFVTPIDNFLRLAGTMEFSGFNLQLRRQRVEMLATGANRYFPSVRHAPEQSRWCHLRPMTPDGLPIIGSVPHLPNVWIATGHGMLGVTQGPITGLLLAESIVQGKTSLDLQSFEPARFL